MRKGKYLITGCAGFIGSNLVKKIYKDYDLILVDDINHPLKKDNKKEVFKGLINHHPCLLIKPLNFMNLSGQPVQEIMSFYKIEKNKLYVIHDDIDLELGKIKFKLGGGNGGHNGLSSIDEKIGNNVFFHVFGDFYSLLKCFPDISAHG